MRKKRKLLSAGSLVLIAVAALLLIGSSVGSTRATLTYYSDNYKAQIEVSDIDVALLENGKETGETLLTHLQKEKGGFLPGKAYTEELSVQNTGSIDSYVRVILKKSWLDPDQKKDTSLSPKLIDVHFPEGSGWVVDQTASTPERTVLYYTGVVKSGETTPSLSDTLKVDSSIITKVEEKKDGNQVTYEYKYDGYTCFLEAEVDAVQTHNAEAAIKSAWGVNVSVGADGTLSLQEVQP